MFGGIVVKHFGTLVDVEQMARDLADFRKEFQIKDPHLRTAVAPVDAVDMFAFKLIEQVVNFGFQMVGFFHQFRSAVGKHH